MSYLSLLLGTGTPARADLNSDLAFMLSAGQTASGMAINPSTALKISTVWACVKLISETIASLPAIVYQRDANGDKTRATNHPLYDLLHTQPNQGQTAFEFFEMRTGLPARDNAGVADSVITNVLASTDTYTVTTGAAFVAGQVTLAWSLWQAI
jgi:hypothetical protein